MFSEIQTIPDAAAEIKGSPEFPKIRGMVYFFGVHNGTIVAADIRNLPDENAFHGFHIHEGTCQGTKSGTLCTGGRTLQSDKCHAPAACRRYAFTSGK